jgi:S-adenosylmethionine-diacylgycerolhomoserine-N-methlytransferase
MHARLYDATRWSFLFGRDAILDLAAAVQPAPERILEIGCGTGRNLVALSRRFPNAELTGVDLSGAMLGVAERKLARTRSRAVLMRRAYGAPIRTHRGFDLVLCSYALSMFNPGYEEAMAAARSDLAPGGCFALVDFHATRFRAFAGWMAVNHVRMEEHLLPALRKNFTPITSELSGAYGGMWHYLKFVGRAKSG